MAGQHVADHPAWAYWPLYPACYATGGWEPGWSGLQALRERRLVDLLMVARDRRGLDRAGHGRWALLIVISAPPVR